MLTALKLTLLGCGDENKMHLFNPKVNVKKKLLLIGHNNFTKNRTYDTAVLVVMQTMLHKRT